MARAIHVTSSASDAQAIAAPATVVGYSAREAAASAAVATVLIRNGTTASDPIVAMIELAADASQTATLPAVDCPNGVFVDRVAGTTELVIYVL